MNSATQRLLSEALQLPEEEREALGLALLDAVPDRASDADVADEWRSEVRARLAELRAGRTTTTSWSQLEAELRARLAGR